jgi:ABC-type transporter Mla MlaB component
MSSSSAPLSIVVRGPLRRSDLPGLCERICRQLAAHPGSLVDCDVTGVSADAVSIDALARLQLGAQRQGCRVRLRDASPELRELVAVMGLTDVLPG